MTDVAFAITAELPLGVYRAAGDDGNVEPIPSVSRLYSALLAAAGVGPRAVARDGDDRTAPCDADEVALRWLEEHPPDGVSVPAIQVNRGRATAYRDDGTIKKTPAAMSIKKLPKWANVSVAVSGTFTWTWSQAPPPGVATALKTLCPDVPYLGTSESPVRLTALDAADPPTHVLDPDADLFSGGGHDVDVPLPGRRDELGAAHDAATGTPPTVARDKWSADEVSRSPVPPRTRVAPARYVRRERPPADVPWPQVVLLPLRRADGRDDPLPESDRVGIAVAMHRALVRALERDVPPLITGRYPGETRPANGLAVHVLDASMKVDLPDAAPAALALLIPPGASGSDLTALSAAVSVVKRLYGEGIHSMRVVGRPRTVMGDELWKPPEAGMVRLWRTVPAAVPDARGARGARKEPWSFTYAALLSLGLVFRDALGYGSRPVKGERRQREVVDAVNARGAVVLEALPLRGGDPHRYVHNVHPDAIVRPYRAQLWLGGLCGDRTMIAIGQARHVGGGLLVPHDVPENTMVAVSSHAGDGR